MGLETIPSLASYAGQLVLAEAALGGGLYRLTQTLGAEILPSLEIGYVANQALDHLRSGIIGDTTHHLISAAQESAGDSLFTAEIKVQRRSIPSTTMGIGPYPGAVLGIAYALHHGLSLSEANILTNPIELGGVSLFAKMSGEEILTWILEQCGMPVEPETYLGTERLAEIKSALESQLPPVDLPTGFRGFRLALTRSGQLRRYLNAVSEGGATPTRRVQLRRGLLEMVRAHPEWFGVREIRNLVEGVERRDAFKVFLLAELAIAGNTTAQGAIQKRNLAEGATIFGRAFGHAGYLGTVNMGYLFHGRGKEKYPLIWSFIRAGSREALEIAVGNYLTNGHFHQYLTEAGDPEQGKAALEIISLALKSAAGFQDRQDRWEFGTHRYLPSFVRDLEAFLDGKWHPEIQGHARTLLKTGDFRDIIAISVRDKAIDNESTLKRLRTTHENQSTI